MENETWKILGALRQDFLGEVDEAILMLKIVEEAGEAAEAFIGAAGHNPRKGVHKTADDIMKELADVIITAGVALVAAAGNDHARAAAVFHANLARVAERSGVAPPHSPARSKADRTSGSSYLGR